LEHGRIVELATFGRLQQLLVGQTAPEEERHTRGQFEIADAINAVWCDRGRILFDAEQEARIREHSFQCELDASVETSLPTTRFEELEQRLQLGLGCRPAVGAMGERRQNSPCAGGGSCGTSGPTEKDAPPAGCVPWTADTIRTADGYTVHALVARFVARK